jgi:hypothetical protein
MATFQYKNGIGKTAAYQVSGRPYILRGTTTGADTVDEVSFNTVTRFIQISASAEMRVGFSELGVTTSDNYFVQGPGLSDIYEWRVSSLFLSGSGATANYEIRAGATSISNTDLPNSWSGSVGVG